VAHAVRNRRPAHEILTLDIDDLDLPARRAKVAFKGGDTEWVYWVSGTAYLLPRQSAAANTVRCSCPTGDPAGAAPTTTRPVPVHRQSSPGL
jgi:hypothetical protein